MRLVEYRIPLPMSVSEYTVGHVYAEHRLRQYSLKKTGMVLSAAAIYEPELKTPEGGKARLGVYTQFTASLAKYVPSWARSLTDPERLVMEVSQWDEYPKIRQVHRVPILEKRLSASIELIYVDNDRGDQRNVHQLSEKELALREVHHMDICNDVDSDMVNQAREYDPKHVYCQEADRGPLKPAWQQACQPVMCVYVLARVELNVWMMRTRIENFLLNEIKEVFVKQHRFGFATWDQWCNLSISQALAQSYELKDLTARSTVPPPGYLSPPLPSTSTYDGWSSETGDLSFRPVRRQATSDPLPSSTLDTVAEPLPVPTSGGGGGGGVTSSFKLVRKRPRHRRHARHRHGDDTGVSLSPSSASSPSSYSRRYVLLPVDLLVVLMLIALPAAFYLGRHDFNTFTLVPLVMFVFALYRWSKHGQCPHCLQRSIIQSSSSSLPPPKIPSADDDDDDESDDEWTLECAPGVVLANLPVRGSSRSLFPNGNGGGGVSRRNSEMKLPPQANNDDEEEDDDDEYDDDDDDDDDDDRGGINTTHTPSLAATLRTYWKKQKKKRQRKKIPRSSSVVEDMDRSTSAWSRRWGWRWREQRNNVVVEDNNGPMQPPRARTYDVSDNQQQQPRASVVSAAGAGTETKWSRQNSRSHASRTNSDDDNDHQHGVKSTIRAMLKRRRRKRNNNTSSRHHKSSSMPSSPRHTEAGTGSGGLARLRALWNARANGGQQQQQQQPAVATTTSATTTSSIVPNTPSQSSSSSRQQQQQPKRSPAKRKHHNKGK